MEDKIHKVMHEFKEGTLRSSSGKKVTSRKQALAIAMSEARQLGSPRKKKKKMSLRDAEREYAKTGF
jgi:hypothetical protein